MKRKILAGLMAALVFGGVPAVQAATAGKNEISIAEIKQMDGFYRESTQAEHLPWLTVEDRRWCVRADGRSICWGS